VPVVGAVVVPAVGLATGADVEISADSVGLGVGLDVAPDVVEAVV